MHVFIGVLTEQCWMLRQLIVDLGLDLLSKS